MPRRSRTTARWPAQARWWGVALVTVLAAVAACGEGTGSPAPDVVAPLAQEAPLSDSAFAALVARLSEPGGYFDTDNLISNESGYLKVMGALGARGLAGGAYVGVGPDQNFSYLVALRPRVAFLVDIRRDNLLHHLLLKALMEASPTRVEFLSALHGKAAPPDPGAWRGRSLADVVAWVDGAEADQALRDTLRVRMKDAVSEMGLPLDSADLATVDRFHRTFMDAGLDLRFTSFGRAPRPYYPTYRQLVLETDLDGDPASYLASEERYAFVRGMQVENRVIPVVGNLAGDHALPELSRVLEGMGVELHAFYASNVEFYLWGDGTFPRWVENLAALPAAEGAVVIRSYFPNFGGTHPSAVPGYYATQTLQPVRTLVEGRFTSYWDVVTRDVVPLR